MNKLKLTLASFAIGVVLMAAPITALAGCPPWILVDDGGPDGLWDCYLAAEDDEMCYYECYAT